MNEFLKSHQVGFNIVLLNSLQRRDARKNAGGHKNTVVENARMEKCETGKFGKFLSYIAHFNPCDAVLAYIRYDRVSVCLSQIGVLSK